MKELSIEEKAKRYDELKVTAQELEHDGCFDKITLFDLFPELKESEDEKIRKWLIRTLKALNSSSVEIEGAYEMMLPAIAWLEKQGEKKKIIADRELTDFEIEVHEIITQARSDKRLSDEETLKQFEQEAACALMMKAKKEQEQKPVEHLELKAGHWYICHRAYCCRADHLTVMEGERFMCEKDGIVKGFVVKNPEMYFIEVNSPLEWSEEDKDR